MTDARRKPFEICLHRQCNDAFPPDACRGACIIKGYKNSVCEYVGRGCCCNTPAIVFVKN